MKQDAKLERLRSLPLFASCDNKALAGLASAVEEVDVPAGRRLIRQGHNTNEAFVVEAGTADVLLDGEKVSEVTAGKIVGEISLLDHGPATADVVSQTPMTLLVIPHNRFAQLLDATPALGASIARTLAARLRAMDAHHHDG
ncbi:MAG: cyclic nucleotide-binding domain-containing protein [Acidimicrobiales bacterium]